MNAKFGKQSKQDALECFVFLLFLSNLDPHLHLTTKLDSITDILDFPALTRDGFSKDICRSMIAMMDFDKSGKLGYEEFKSLWQSLRDWKVNNL